MQQEDMNEDFTRLKHQRDKALALRSLVYDVTPLQTTSTLAGSVYTVADEVSDSGGDSDPA
jgi:hypothetical protein